MIYDSPSPKKNSYTLIIAFEDLVTYVRLSEVCANGLILQSLTRKCQVFMVEGECMRKELYERDREGAERTLSIDKEYRERRC